MDKGPLTVECRPGSEESVHPNLLYLCSQTAGLCLQGMDAPLGRIASLAPASWLQALPLTGREGRLTLPGVA